MNERIRELAINSGAATTLFDREGHYHIMSPELEKFAELIVRECAKFLEEKSGYDSANNAWHPEPEDLLKHFGVDE